jgi:hypothetical protein
MTSGSVPPKRKMVPRYFYLRPDEFKALKQRAEQDNLTHSEIVRLALRAYLGLPLEQP